MNLEIPLPQMVGFLMALVRTSTWMAIAPPFRGRLMPRTAKVGTAAAISLVLASHYPADKVTFDQTQLFTMVITQIVAGLALGFLTEVLFAAIQAAGATIDILSGFTMSQALDPLMNNQSSVFSRLYQMVATTILFVTNGHLLLLKGFMTSFDAVPMSGPNFDNMRELLIKDLSTFTLASVEIAAPLVGTLFLTEVTLGLLSKAAPQLNVFTFGFPVKLLVTILLVGWAMPLIPGAVDTLVTHSLRDGIALMRAGGG